MKGKERLSFLAVVGGLALGCGASMPLRGVPPPLPGPNLPGEDQRETRTYWLAPYVRASEGFGGITVTWLAGDGTVKRRETANTIHQGFVSSLGAKQEIQGVSEDWRFVLPKKSGPSGYITATPDSRVFVHEFHPVAGEIALDIYVHGKLSNTVGPFLQYRANDVALNEDGSAGLLVWKDKTRSGVQIVTLDANGKLRFRVDCDRDVHSLLVAPEGAGALVRPNTGGTNQNTFIWFGHAGKGRALELSPNPWCVGWIPGTHKSLFSTSTGSESNRLHLVDWDAGKELWTIACPGDSTALAVGIAQKLILFAVPELYTPGPWRGAQWGLRNGGKESIRVFYAVDVENGSIRARWQADFPQRLDAEFHERFLRLDKKLYFLTDSEFTEMNLEDIIARSKGWR